MLLFVRNPYYRDIQQGVKRFEIRAGTRYSNLACGDELCINARFRVRITKVHRFDCIRKTAIASEVLGYPVTLKEIDACYPQGGPYYVFEFTPPQDAELPRLT